jgi:hypothetical protein
LRPNGFDAPARDAIGLAILRTDEAPLFQAKKHVEGTVAEDMTIARVTGDGAYLAALAPFVVDGSTKGEFMQNTLLVFRDIQRIGSIS